MLGVNIDVNKLFLSPPPPFPMSIFLHGMSSRFTLMGQSPKTMQSDFLSECVSLLEDPVTKRILHVHF